RISGAPGKFRLKATPPNVGMVGMAEVRADGSTEAVYGETYYPSASTAERATPVEAVAGRDVTGIEIRFVRQRNNTITGSVSGIPQGSHTLVTLRWGESADRMYSNRTNPVSPEGTFRFQALPQAPFYQIAAFTMSEPQLRSSFVDVHLDSETTEV